VLPTQEREARTLELASRLRGAFSVRDWDVVRCDLEAHGVPFGPVHDDAELGEDPQLWARGLVQTVEGGSGTAAGHGFRTLRQPIMFDGERGGTVTPAPRLGQHTRDLAVDIGYGEDSIADLEERGVLGIDAARRSA